MASFSSKCVKCGTELDSTYPTFTGTCNYNKGQYILFYFCPNEKCDRYHLYCYIGSKEM